VVAFSSMPSPSTPNDSFANPSTTGPGPAVVSRHRSTSRKKREPTH
jgi:hypothetical protein